MIAQVTVLFVRSGSREQVCVKANAAQTVGKSSDRLQGEGGEVFNGATKQQVPTADDLAELFVEAFCC